MKTLLNAGMSALLFCNLAHAQGVYLGAAQIEGSGCENGSARAVLAPDASSFSILFDRSEIRVGSNDGRDGGAGCRIRLPIQVEPGFQLQVVKLDYRGYADIPLGSVGQFYTANWFYTNSRQWKFGFDSPVAKMIPGPIRDQFFFSQAIDTSNVTTACGENLNLELRLSWKINTLLGPRREGMLTLDSIDGSTDSPMGALYGLRVSRCDPYAPPVPTPPTPPSPPSMPRLSDQNCSSNNSARATCETGAPISRLVLKRTLSRARCVENQSYGVEGTRIWVSRGCRGLFDVY